MKLAQLEQDLKTARRQGVYGSLLKKGSSGIATFEVEYQSWVEERRKKDDELRKVLVTHTSDIELQIYVDDGLNHYHDLFRMKAYASKADVFYLMNGPWTTPILMPQLQLTDTQLMKARSLRQSCEQVEEGLSQGLEKLQQTLAQCIMIDITVAGSYSTQMNSTMKRLEALETFFN